MPSTSAALAAMLTWSPGAIWLATPRSASTVTVTATRLSLLIWLANALPRPSSADTNVPAVMNCFAFTGPDSTLPLSWSRLVMADGGNEPLATFSLSTSPACSTSAPVVPLAMSALATYALTNDALSWARLSAPDAYMYTPIPATSASTMAAAAINVRRFDTATPLGIRSGPSDVRPPHGKP